MKLLYAHPLPDVAHVPSLSDCLLTPEEGVEQRRREEERERNQFVAPRQPAFTQDQDEVSTRAVLVPRPCSRSDLISAIHACARMCGKQSVNVSINKLSHMAKSSTEAVYVHV